MTEYGVVVAVDAPVAPPPAENQRRMPDPGDKHQVPLVYVLVLNWNCWTDTVRCLSDLERSTYRNACILVLDNCSHDDSVERIQEAYPTQELIETGGNFGYGGGNNVGILRALEAGADFILLLNPDVYLPPDTLSRMVTSAKSRKDMGALCPVVRYQSDPERIWFAGSTINWKRAKALHKLQAPTKSNGVIETAWTCGCCMLMSADALRSIGLIDDSYFLYFEEVDLCHRMNRAGFKAGVCVDATAFHSPHSTTGSSSPLQAYYMKRNHLLFFTRYATEEHASKFVVVLLLLRRYLLCDGVPSGLIRRAPGAVASIYACWDFLRGRVGPSPRYS